MLNVSKEESLFVLMFAIVWQLVELKNGETYNGHLVNCDTWMNIHLREVICTSKVYSFSVFFLYIGHNVFVIVAETEIKLNVGWR